MSVARLWADAATGAAAQPSCPAAGAAVPKYTCSACLLTWKFAHCARCNCVSVLGWQTTWTECAVRRTLRSAVHLSVIFCTALAYFGMRLVPSTMVTLDAGKAVHSSVIACPGNPDCLPVCILARQMLNTIALGQGTPCRQSKLAMLTSFYHQRSSHSGTGSPDEDARICWQVHRGMPHQRAALQCRHVLQG